MSKMVYCTVLKREAEALDTPPYPGELGQRIYAQVSQAGWQRWLERMVLIINENKLNTADPRAVMLLEESMRGFLFGEGDKGKAPPGFQPRH
jgi:Fe-S cluster biosynthesis and repair protein YggX